MKRKITNKGWVFISLGLLILVVIAIQLRYNMSLKKNGTLTNARVIGEGRTYKGNLTLRYEFYVDGKKYEEETDRLDLYNNAGRIFLEREFPVLYSISKPSFNKLLVTPKDFEFCNRTYPDSLSWVLEFVK